MMDLVINVYAVMKISVYTVNKQGKLPCTIKQ